MSKELTPMMEAIEVIVKHKKDVRVGRPHREGYDNAMDYCIQILESKLPKEKQGYEDAYDQGKVDEETIHPTYSDGKDYYNTKYNNK